MQSMVDNITRWLWVAGGVVCAGVLLALAARRITTMKESEALGFVLDEKAHLLVRIAELERELRELKECRKDVLYGPPNGLDKWDREHT